MVHEETNKRWNKGSKRSGEMNELNPLTWWHRQQWQRAVEKVQTFWLLWYLYVLTRDAWTPEKKLIITSLVSTDTVWVHSSLHSTSVSLIYTCCMNVLVLRLFWLPRPRCFHIYVSIFLKYNVFDCYKYKRHINLSLSLVLALTSRVSHGRQSFEVFLQGAPPPIRPNVHNPPPSLPPLSAGLNNGWTGDPTWGKIDVQLANQVSDCLRGETKKQSDGAAQTLVRVKVWGKRGRVTGPPGVDTQNGAALLLLSSGALWGVDRKVALGCKKIDSIRGWQRDVTCIDCLMMRHLLVTLWLEQAISDKAEYRVNHDATFVLATLDSYMTRIPRKMSISKSTCLSSSIFHSTSRHVLFY